MHVNRTLLGWGVFFLVLGAVPLAVRAGVVDSGAFANAWQLWPLLLIGAGLGLVLARTRAAVVGNLVVGVTFGLMAGGLVVSGIGGFGRGITACGGSPAGGTPFADQRGALGTEARVALQLDCGRLAVAPVDGNQWTVTGSSWSGHAPVISSAADELTVGTKEPPSNVPFGTNRGVDWRVEVPRSTLVRLDLSVNAGSATGTFDAMRLDRVGLTVNAGSATLDLSHATELAGLEASVNAGSLSVSLPATAVTGSVSANAGSVQLCTPDGVALRIRVDDNALGSNNFGEAGLVRQGDTWTTPGAGGSPTIDLSASANLGSIELNPEGGCA